MTSTVLPGGGKTSRRRLCFVATVPFAINVFLRAHIHALQKYYDVTLVANGSAEDLIDSFGDHVSFVPLPIERKISLKNDICALFRLWRLFRKERFDGVHSIMPKAGLLSMLAARLAGVRLRVHTFTGQVWANKKGFRRFVLKSFDKVLAMNATQVFADSHSQCRFLIENNIVKARAIDVLGEGSVVGVNIKRFEYSQKVWQQIRSEHQIPGDAVVFMFMGRLTRDKGLMDLSRAFSAAARQNANIHLLIVGSDEEGLEQEFYSLAKNFPGRVHRAGFAEHPEEYLSAADVFCLPSYREGFGSVLIEAAAVGLPSIASRIYGITDAVEDGVTGILHHPASDREIAEAMLQLASNEGLRRQMGGAARQRAIEKFSEEHVTEAWVDFYRRSFSTAGQA
jgi:glycosyltransferase involved in cell wall biosynthesis